MNARTRRLSSDYNRIKDEFYGHQYIRVIPLEGNPPVKYLITYKVNGLVWNEDQKEPVKVNKHEVEIYLHKNYPREKPQCRMKTKIFHPNFSSKVCIADHWAAGESLADIVIQIGQMIQYQSYNPKSPLNQAAARWTIKNKHLLPVGNVDLYQAEPDIVFNATNTEKIEDVLEIELY